jgi:hypothetical protein
MLAADRFETRMPCAANAVEIFKDQWLSRLPLFNQGTSNLFDDSRIMFFDQAVCGFSGKRVMELGPLEGGHTYMMSCLGAADIIAIEANKDAFLRCLVAKEVFNIRAKFVCGDFEQLLCTNPPRVDVIVASGVLYHMDNPLRLIEAMTQAADWICVWTHYYQADIIQSSAHLQRKFASPIEHVTFRGRTIRLARQSYLEDVASGRFAGGTEPCSRWIERAGIIDAFDACSFDVNVHGDQVSHPHGPAFTFVAKRRRS